MERNDHMAVYDSWSSMSNSILTESCTPDGDNPPVDFWIFQQALSLGIGSSKKIVLKYCYCFWWGLQNLRGFKPTLFQESFYIPLHSPIKAHYLCSVDRKYAGLYMLVGYGYEYMRKQCKNVVGSIFEPCAIIGGGLLQTPKSKCYSLNNPLLTNHL